ncbi:thioredoxin domain-containing protein [Anaerotruncus rubiinfantis]|uniref:thioredoxin domain-containing protein n=1 Tax=Anaerotruncus rubiinfantis TaxID=1720200 RepID=UPI0008307AD7|nr:thioredoxin domain-containing protein [Anaerotruncus rubiinfantis]
MSENRLIHEKSPYLLQHAHNPVEWYPWGAEAFEAALREDKPIFLSIGYSTCHWCHVMERESFEDAQAAELLNRAFIAIKVDREERPDIDAVYMAVCQALTGAGGWPLTILMGPDQKPFWAGTYLPKRSRYGQLGLVELLEQVSSLWRTGREQLLQAGDEIAAHIASQKPARAAEPDKALPRAAAALFRRGFDPRNGGFGNAPKFPAAHNLLFLMEYSRLNKDADAMSMAETTLIQMARGGLFDQVGGGFSRYSTDEKWLAPHFEKMLYDNALLTYAYLEAFARTGREFYRGIVRRTLDYVLRELTGPEGEFYCGQDADSGGEEGRYYLFTPDEVKNVLGQEDGDRFCRWYDVTARGNFEGKNIPNLLGNDSFEQDSLELADMRERLSRYRRSREELHRDDKVLTAWNALMIAALAKAYRVLGEVRYLEAANRAAAFLRENLTRPDGRLWLRWREGEAAHDGQLDDYAFYAWALLELYAAGADISHLREAIRLSGELETHFWDARRGGFHLTAADAEQLITRPKEVYDGAMPSGNSAAGLVLIRLWKLTGESRWQALADRQLAFLAGSAGDYPSGHCFALLALMEALYPSRELVCASADTPPEGLREIAEQYRLYTLVKTRENAEQLAICAPFTGSYPLPQAGTAFYLCQNGSCAAPVTSLSQLEKLL